jgi:hypothetical protein
LAKRRAQLKQAVGAMVQLASKYVDELTDEVDRIEYTIDFSAKAARHSTAPRTRGRTELYLGVS